MTLAIPLHQAPQPLIAMHAASMKFILGAVIPTWSPHVRVRASAFQLEAFGTEVSGRINKGSVLRRFTVHIQKSWLERFHGL